MFDVRVYTVRIIIATGSVHSITVQSFFTTEIAQKLILMKMTHKK